MEACISILTSLAVEPIRDYIVTPIQRHATYAFTYKTNVEKLKKQLENLTDETDKLQLDCKEATGRGDDLMPDVQKWLQNATQAIERANDLIRNHDEAANTCFNLKKRYHLSKNAEHNSSAISELQNSSKFDRISRLPPLKQRVASTVNEEKEDLDSRSSILKQVMDSLADPQVNMIGVYGIGGVGKTTLAYRVEKLASKDKSFDFVCMVLVSSTPDFDKIRIRIAELLGLKFGEETTEGKADRLHQTLMKKNKILIILDDVWEEVSLNTIGIPNGKEHKGCKIMLTSRIRDVLLRMNSERNFSLDSLSPEEAWTLFRKMVGDIKTEVRDIATQVATKCGGLPLLIATVAKALKNKELNDWKYALMQLSRADADGFQAVVHSALELSYNHLPSDRVKSFFLFCAQLGLVEIMIQDLFVYSVGLDLLPQDVHTMEDAKIIVLKWISDLEASGFLVDSYGFGFVRMHELVQNAALSIASKDQNLLVAIKNWTGISMPLSKFHGLPQRVECERANFLLLDCVDGSLEIPDSFFEGTKSLKVLHLINFYFSLLPVSLGSLTNLRALSLQGCRLLNVAVIGKLKNLQILSFRNSAIEELPAEIRELTRLKSLDLSFCNSLMFIPEDVLSRLSLLEELYVGNSFSQWGIKTLHNQRNASLDELEGLSRITTLDICVPHPKIIPRGFFFNNLVSYKITIGGYWPWWNGIDDFSKLLKLVLYERIHSEPWVKILLKKSEHLSLDFSAETGIIKNILFDLDGEGFPQLKFLHLQNGPNIHYLINSLNRASCESVFPILEILSLFNLTSLEKICHGPFPTRSFSELTVLKVTGCNSLKNLFSSSMVRAIPKLQQLEVYSCSNMEEIVAMESEDEDNEVFVFSHLRYLSIQFLPQLRSFCSGVSRTRQEQLTEIVPEVELAASASLFNDLVAFPAVEEIYINNIVNMEKIWQSPLATGSFAKLKSIAVIGCGKLETVFPFNLMGTFQVLENLWISGCLSLQEIYQLQEENPAYVEFQLKRLHIEYLPKLKQIWSKGPQETISFHKLQSVEISNCEALENLFPSSIARGVLQLQQIIIINCGIQEIVAKPDLSPLLPKLTYLILNGLPKLRYVFTQSMALQIQDMRILNCEMLEEIICSELTEKTAPQQIVGLLSLKSVTVGGLPKLSFFYSGSGNLYFPSLKRIQISGMPFVPRMDNEGSKQRTGDHMQIVPFFNSKVGPNVDELDLDSSAAEMMLHCQLTEEFFSAIKVVYVRDTIQQKSSAVSLSHFLTRLHNLEELCLIDSFIKELFGHGGGKEDTTRLPPIRKLELRGLNYLRYIWKQDFKHQFVHHLEFLKVSFCQQLTSLAPSSASFQNLTTLFVDFCNKLTTLVTASVAKSMVQLVSMDLVSCQKLKEIVASEEGENTEEIVFSRLKRLHFGALDNLESFCSCKNCTFKFPSLEEVSLNGCPKMRIFCNQELSTPKLTRIQVFPSGKWYWKDNLNATIQYVYMEMAGFDGRLILDLKLSEHPQLQEKWNSDLPLKFLNIVDNLVVDNCSSISKALPSNVLHFLSGVETLKVEKCDSVEQIFDLKGLNFEEVMNVRLMTSLTFLSLIDLPKLKHLFTLSMALGLMGLMFMEVRGCVSLEQIIRKEEDEEEPATWDKSFIFPELGTLKLRHLPELTSFYSETGVLICPSLKKIHVLDCPKIKILDSAEETQENVVQGDSQPQVPHLLNAQVAVPSLKKLGVDWVVMKEMWHKKSEAVFCRLKTLRLRRYPGDCEVLPSDFLQKLPKLDKIVVTDSIMEEIFIDEESKKEFHGSLELSKLPNLKSQPTKHFPNLTNLEISECDGLVFLVPYSAAKTLSLLKSMVIYNCQILQEIVASEGDGEENDEICFSQLQNLTFHSLPCLKSFCSHNYAISFPSLVAVTIKKCPNMKYFAPGVLTTPKLQRIFLEGDLCWEGSLDNTVREFAERREE